MSAAPLVIKRAPAGALAIDGQGVFEGYASLFDAPDLGGDVIVPGAFAHTLGARAARDVKMLWQHDPKEPIGAWLSLVEDGRGLKARGRLNLAVARAREAHALMREGALDGLSIGFRPRRATRDKASGLRRIHSLDLVEISIVTFPMLPGARVQSVKAGASVHAAPRDAWLAAAARLQSAIERGR